MGAASEVDHLRDLQHGYEEERSAEWMYLRLAERDSNAERATMLRELAAYELRHSVAYEDALKRHGSAAGPWRKQWIHRLPVIVSSLFGVGSVFQFLSSSEAHEVDECLRQIASAPDETCREAMKTILADEVVHESRLWERARAEQSAGHGALRSSVLGANDGLVSILALVAGVAGYDKGNAFVLIAGLAGLVAGAVSMAASNYVSVKAEQEAYRAKVDGERVALESVREVKLGTLKQTLQRKGFTPAESDSMVSRLAADDQKLLGAILYEEHGIGEAVFAKPGKLAWFTGLSFAVAGVLPVIPFVIFLSYGATLLPLILSVIFGAVGLFILGVMKTVVTFGSAIRSGAEMVAIGLGAAGLTYLVGLLVGLQGIA